MSDVVVTDAIGSDITQLSNQSSTSTTLSVPIPDGYYSSRRILVDEPALLAANIKSGVTGTASGIAGNCVTNGLQSSACTAATSTFWTTVAGNNITSWANASASTVVTGVIPDGYYSSKTIAFTDANLLAANISSGVSIFGVTGTQLSPYANCSEDSGTINASKCSTSVNRYVSSVLGTNITIGTNAGATTTVSAAIPDGYYKTKSVSFTDANLIASRIASGFTIFGVTGNFVCSLSGCSDNALNAGACSTAVNRYVSPTLGSNITVSGGTTSLITQGYYDGTKNCTVSDANLVASKILTGNTILGVAGSVVAAYSPCTDNAINAGTCSTATNRYVTATAGANVNGSAGSLSATIPLGYYDGTKTATMSDANLLAANIKCGTTLFGVSGSLTSVYPTCVEDNGTINATACSTGATNRYVSSVLGANITTGTNAGATTTVSATIPDGYYNSKSVSFTDANLVATKIVSGNTIFGVTGSATAAYSACTDNTLNVPQCSTTANRYVTPTAGADVTIWTNTLANTTVTASLTNGFYSSKSCLLTDANLVAANIKSGTSVFGVTGTLNSIYSTCQEDNGTINGAICTTSTTNRYVSSVLGSNITSGANAGATTTFSATIPDGYYKTKSVSFTDANLVAAKILNGTTIFGVTGSVVAAYGVCTDNAINAGACSTATNRYVSPTLGSNITVSGGTTALITLGFYDGTKSCQVSDANLVASKILNGTTILGVVGSVNAAYSACSDDTFNASQCSTAASRYVSGTLGSAISSWTNASSTTTVTGSIPGGFYPTAPLAISFTDANLLAANIKSTVSIFNVTGALVPLMSNQHRNKATTQVEQLTESTTNAATAYTNADPGYRAVPIITKDDDGYSGGNVTFVTRTNWDTTCDATTGAGGGTANSVCKCGTTGTIAQRIANCAAHTVIGANATWDGSTKGNAGQGTWKLITRTGALTSSKGREVWRDERTKMMWSSLLSSAGLNWCKASGSNFITNNPSAENDASNYCNNATYQATGTGPATQAISACFEDGNYFTTTDAAIDNAGKGGLNLASTPLVAWRLPIKYDYQQADNDGIRFVLPEMAAAGGGYEWSASVFSVNRAYAWLFYGANGNVYNLTRVNNYSVRCIAR